LNVKIHCEFSEVPVCHTA